MDEITRWLLVNIAIFIGILARTALPALRKSKKIENFIFELKWVGTAVTAFWTSNITILGLIPTTLTIEAQVILAFAIAFAENGIFNEIIQWRAHIPKREKTEVDEVEDPDIKVLDNPEDNDKAASAKERLAKLRKG